MGKIVNFIRHTSNILLIIIAFSNIFYLLWLFLAQDIYWPLYSKIANLFQWIVFWETCLFLPTLLLSNFKTSIRLVTFFILTAMSYLTLGFIGDPTSYLNSSKVNDKTIILGDYGLHNGSNCYQLLECKANGTYCRETNPKMSRCTGDFEPNVMLIDNAGRLNVFINGVLTYIYGDRSYNFEYGDSTDYKDHIYWVVYTGRGDDLLYKFGMCDIETKQTCEILQSYSNPGFNHMNLAVSTEGKDLYIYFLTEY